MPDTHEEWNKWDQYNLWTWTVFLAGFAVGGLVAFFIALKSGMFC